MIRRPPRSTRSDTLFPYTTRFRSQVAQRVEDLVTHELVFVAQTVVIEDAVMTKHHGILQRSAAGEAQRTQMLDLLHETEGAGAGDIGLEAARPKLEGGALATVRSEARRVGKDGVRTGRSRWW